MDLIVKELKSARDPLFKKWYDEVYLPSFDKSERVSWNRLCREMALLKNPKSSRIPVMLVALTPQGKLVYGQFAYFIKPGRMAFSMYVATRLEFRNRGIGEFMQNYFAKLLSKRHNASGFFLESEVLKKVIPGDPKTDRAKFYERLGFNAFKPEKGKGHVLPNLETYSLYKGAVPFDLRYRPLTKEVKESLKIPEGRRLQAMRAFLSIYRGLYDKSRKSPLYPRLTANVAARRALGIPLSQKQVSKTTRPQAVGELIVERKPRPAGVNWRPEVIPKLQSLGVAARTAKKPKIRVLTPK